MVTSASLRQIDSTMAKYRPINLMEPSLSSLLYVGGFSCVALGSPTLSIILIILQPIFMMFGFIPQIECLIYGLFDSLTLYLNLPINLIQSICFNSCFVAMFIIRPVEALFAFALFCFIQMKYHQVVKLVLEAIICVAGLAVCIVFRIINVPIYWQLSSLLIDSALIHYIVLGISVVASIIFIILEIVRKTMKN